MQVQKVLKNLTIEGGLQEDHLDLLWNLTEKVEPRFPSHAMSIHSLRTNLSTAPFNLKHLATMTFIALACDRQQSWHTQKVSGFRVQGHVDITVLRFPLRSQPICGMHVDPWGWILPSFGVGCADGKTAMHRWTRLRR